MRKLLISPVVALSLLAGVTCGGGSNGTPTPTPDFESRAQAIVPSVPLALDNLPGGWVEAAEGETDLTQSADLPDECNIFDLDVAFPNAFVTAAGPHVHDGGRQVTSYAAIYRTTDDAQKDVDGTRDLLDRCEGNYKSAVEKVADEALSALGIHLGFLAGIDVTLAELPEATGDGSRSYRLQAKVSLPGDDLTFTLGARVVRVGRVVGAMTYYAQGEGGTDEERDITAALVVSATEADGALPQ